MEVEAASRGHRQALWGVVVGLAVALAMLTYWAVGRPTGYTSTQGAPAGEAIGSSAAGAPIMVRTFGSGPRKVLVIAGVHGDEYGTAVAAALVAQLANGSAVFDGPTTLSVVECLNPDGLRQNTRGNRNGVDLNRNMPSADWQPTLDEGDISLESGLSGGTAPASEPETKALVDLLERDFDLVISLHSEGGIVDFDGPGADVIAEQISADMGLPVRHVAYQPYVHGSLGRYLTEQNTPLITIELTTTVLTDGVRKGLLGVTAIR